MLETEGEGERGGESGDNDGEGKEVHGEDNEGEEAKDGSSCCCAASSDRG